MADPDAFLHADDSDDDAFAPGDVPAEEVDWDEVEKVQAVFDDVADPNTATTPIDGLRAIYGDDLEVI